MRFEKNDNPFKSLKIGSGRFIKVLWVSKGGCVDLGPFLTREMFTKWELDKNIPRGVYPLIEISPGQKRFVETEKLAGELIEYNKIQYQL
jgi:hypothetical protein